MRKFGIITRILIFLGISKKKIESEKKTGLDAWLERERNGFPFSELLGMEIKCGEKVFNITAETEKNSYKEKGMSRGLVFQWWVVNCPFCEKHKFRIGADLSAETMD